MYQSRDLALAARVFPRAPSGAASKCMMRAVILTLAVLLAGCGTIGQTGADSAAADAAALATNMPSNYRQQIVQAFLTEQDYHFRGVKDAEVSNPAQSGGPLKPIDGSSWSTVCVRFRMRLHPDWASFTDMTESFAFDHGKLIHEPEKKRVSASGFECLQDRTYTPFPEANKEYSGTDYRPFPDVNRE